MRSFARTVATAALAAGILVSCGSSDSRDRNVEVALGCAQGGPCRVGETGPAGGIVVQGGETTEDEMWETAPVNGYGTFDEAVADVEDFTFGGLDGWVLPSATVIDVMYDNADLFACAEGTDCITSYAPASYWTSDVSEGGANVKSFVDGGYTVDPVTATNYYRPVRSFRMGEAIATTTTVEETTTTAEETTTTAAETTTTTVQETTTTVEETTTTVEETTTTLADEPTTAVGTTTTLADETATTQAPNVPTTAAAPTTTEPPVKVATCAEGGPCNVGDKGPAGGTILLADFMLSDPPTLIEVAPTTWYGNAVKAKSYVDNLVYGGFDNWQIPNLSQLLTMRRERVRFICPAGTRCTNGFVPSTYWAAKAGNPTNTVSFAGTGDPQVADPTTSHFVRPVRVIAAVAGNPEVTLQEPDPS